MFFFNGRIRNTHIAPVIAQERQYTHKLGHSCVIIGCLLIVIGLIFIITGVVSETKKTTFFSTGIIILSVGFFLSILVCFYTKLTICYHNWAYGPHIVPNKINNTQALTITAITIAPLPSKHVPTTTIKDCRKTLSDEGINKIIIIPAERIGKTKTRIDNVT